MLAALLPVALVAASLTALFLYRHLTDIDRALERRGQALARQTAASVEFSLITGNRELQQSIGLGVLRTESDARGVAIADPENQILMQIGTMDSTTWPQRAGVEAHVETPGADVFIVPVEQHTLAVDDIYSGAEIAVAKRPRKLLGHVIVEVSRERVAAERTRLILMAVLAGFGGLVLGGGLALGIVRAVNRPVLDATDVVTRIGRGDLAARVRESTAGPLRDLAVGINSMAHRVGLTQEQLQARIDSSVKELVRQRDAAERATKAKSRFLASASHDLRQPLHALGLFVAQLARMDWSDQRRELFLRVESSVTSLQEMLGALLDLSKLDAGGQRPDIKCFALEPLLKKVSQEIEPLAEEKHLAHRIRLRNLHVNSDPALVERLVFNLLTNAVRYTRRGGFLLACRPFGDQARIQVWDTGIGIEDHVQEEVFEEYFQAGNDERDRGKGLGLGLAICRRIARILGTEIELRSTPGKGSVFQVDLPLAFPVEIEPVTTVVTPPRFDVAVMLLDNDDASRDASAALLASWGANVVTAGSVDAALVICDASTSKPEIVICDLQLTAGKSDIDVIVRLHESCPNAGIILISAEFSPATRERAKKYSFPLLRKPVAPARLRATLQTLIQKPSP